MTCTPIQIGNATGILCGGTRRGGLCHYCRNVAPYACDSPVFRDNKKGTCDMPLCESCRNNIGPELDLCRAHFNAWRNNGNKFVIGGNVVSTEG